MRKLLFLLTILLPTFANAYDARINGIYYNLDKIEKTAEVTYYSNSTNNKYGGIPENLNIPSSVNYNGDSYVVTRIGNSAFYCCSNLSSVIIPNSVTSIGSWSFRDCTGLTSVTIPSSVTVIEGYAFYSCI